MITCTQNTCLKCFSWSKISNRMFMCSNFEFFVVFGKFWQQIWASMFLQNVLIIKNCPGSLVTGQSICPISFFHIVVSMNLASGVTRWGGHSLHQRRWWRGLLFVSSILMYWGYVVGEEIIQPVSLCHGSLCLINLIRSNHYCTCGRYTWRTPIRTLV